MTAADLSANQHQGHKAMTNFAIYHEGQWRDGEMPKISGATYIVSYDTRNHAYHIQNDDFEDFMEWVAIKFEVERDPREEDEGAGDYLDRIGCSVRAA